MANEKNGMPDEEDEPVWHETRIGVELDWIVSPFVTENEKLKGKGEFVKPLNCFLYAAAYGEKDTTVRIQNEEGETVQKLAEHQVKVECTSTVPGVRGKILNGAVETSGDERGMKTRSKTSFKSNCWISWLDVPKFAPYIAL